MISTPALDDLVATQTNSPLPVDFTFYNAELIRDQTYKISWATSTEINNEKFIVQYANDGLHFVDIHTELGNRNSITTNFYSCQVVIPFAENHYFRIQQIDFDGTKELTPIFELNDLKNNLDFTQFQPTLIHNSSNGIGLTFSRKNETPLQRLIEVFTIHGQKLYSSYADNNKENYEISGLEKGLYIINIFHGNGQKESVKFIKT